MTKPIRCAIIGQHPMRFPWGFDEEDDRCRKLKIELAQQIMALRQSGVSQFLAACDCGVGLYAAEIVNGLRATTDHDLMLICYTPHEEQATRNCDTPPWHSTMICCANSIFNFRQRSSSSSKPHGKRMGCCPMMAQRIGLVIPRCPFLLVTVYFCRI